MVGLAVKGPPEPPVPSPDLVTASRRHLTERYADGVDRVLWDLEGREMPGTDAIRKLLAAAADEPPDALDIGAALVTLGAVRLEMDLLEADVFDAAKASGVMADSLAAVIGLPDADAVDARYRALVAKRALPRALAWRVALKPHPPGAARKAAERAAERANRAADRADAARRRREQLAKEKHQGVSGGRELADAESAYASEAQASAREAAERVALGLLRAAEALDRCASRCGEWETLEEPGISRQLLRRRAKDYTKAARGYRDLADRYRGAGDHE